MPYGIYLSAAGANAQSHRLEVLSHNLANINTDGFKPHFAVLQSRHAEAIENGDATAGDGTVDDVGGGVTIEPNETQFIQGPLKVTGNPTDFAINDTSSFFSVQRGDKQLLTRAGNFSISPEGNLVTQNGDIVLSSEGGPITVDPSQPMNVTDDGAILQGLNRQSVRLVRPQATGDLSRVGDNLYESLTPVSDVPDQQRAVRSHTLEASAVKPTQAMMELIEASRAYEANVRLIQTQDEAIGQLLGRVLKQ